MECAECGRSVLSLAAVGHIDGTVAIADETDVGTGLVGQVERKRSFRTQRHGSRQNRT